MRQYVALALGVIAVAKEGAINDWAAYIGKTEGNNHLEESFEIEKHGAKLPYKIAKAIFPTMDKEFSWRD